MSRGPGYSRADDAAIWDACHRRRVDRIRDLADLLGRSEVGIRRQYQRLCRTGGIGTGSHPYFLRPDHQAALSRLLFEAAAAGDGLTLAAEDVAKLVGGEGKRR